MTLDGPKVDPLSGEKAKTLIVFLHGFGADGADLIGLAHQWGERLPETAFVSPHAPEPCAMNPFGGRQWFELTFRDTEEYWRGVNQAAPLLNKFLDDELARLELNESQLALVGFSQGTMMALHVGLRRRTPLAAVVGYSGMLIGDEHINTDIKSRPPILLIHGDSDDVIPIAALSHAENNLKKAGLTVETHISKNIGHGIDDDGLTLGGAFLQKALHTRSIPEA